MDCCILVTFNTLVSSLGFSKGTLIYLDKIIFVISVGDLRTIPNQLRKPIPGRCFAQGDLTDHLAGESRILLLSSY